MEHFQWVKHAQVGDIFGFCFTSLSDHPLHLNCVQILYFAFMYKFLTLYN